MLRWLFRGLWRWGAPAGLLALLAACGPGIGGTGTGTDHEAPSPTAAPVPLALCDSDLSPLLRCAAGATVAGSTLMWWADGGLARDALLRLEGNAVDFDAACSGWQFSGVWAAAGPQPARFHGTVRSATGAVAPQAGTLTAQRVAGALMVQLFDDAGRSLAGPFTLQAVELPPPGTCR